MREEIEGAFDCLGLVFGCSIGLKLEEPHFESQAEIRRRRRGRHEQQVIQSLLFATGAPAIAEIEVIANRLVRKVNLPDPEPTVGDFGTHEILAALVGLGLGNISDWYKVEFPGTAGCVLNNAEFAHRIGSSWVEFELIGGTNEAGQEARERQRSLVRKYTPDRRAIRPHLGNPLRHYGRGCGRLSCGNGRLHGEVTLHDPLGGEREHSEPIRQIKRGMAGGQ